jgi:hypothetical protein
VNDPKVLYRTVVELCDVVSAQQKELLYVVAAAQAVAGVLAENDSSFQARFQAKYSLAQKNPGEAMQALHESCRRLSEVAQALKAEFGPWDN